MVDLVESILGVKPFHGLTTLLPEVKLVKQLVIRCDSL